jgi:hypothetical protein
MLHIPKAKEENFNSVVSTTAPRSASPSANSDFLKSIQKEDAAFNPQKLGIPIDPSHLSAAQKAKVKAELQKVTNALKEDLKNDTAFANKAGYLPPIPGHPGV